ncbi:YdcF family protein [Promicromonospora sp. NPDC019610]|uniref:YdcF family protein n=1 Tax=Promicromonospora sp. NPDC019610 TaxID=3364405 RepID=UPI003790361E
MPLLWIVVGAVLLLDALVVWIATVLSSGVVATFGLGVLYLLHGLHGLRRGRNRGRTPAGRGTGPFRWTKVLVPAATALLLVLLAALAAFGRTDTVSHQEDAVIVLGAGLKGEEVTPSLRSRLDVAVGYSVANPEAVVVVAGGQGPGESISEALAMERYLVAHGVRADRILREDRSTSTHENFVLAKRLLDERFEAGCTTAFITSDYHVFRASGIAERAGIGSTHAHADTPWYEIPVDHVRESLAITKFFLTGR